MRSTRLLLQCISQHPNGTTTRRTGTTIRATPASTEHSPLSALSMGTQRSVRVPRLPKSWTNPQTAIVHSLFRVFLSCSYQSDLPGASSAFYRVRTSDLQLAIFRSPYPVIHPLSTPHISGGSLRVTTRNKRMYAIKVCPSLHGDRGEC